MDNFINVYGCCNHYLTDEEGVTFGLRHTSISFEVEDTVVSDIVLNRSQSYKLDRYSLDQMYSLLIDKYPFSSHLKLKMIRRRDDYFFTYVFDVVDADKKVKRIYDYDEILNTFRKADWIDFSCRRDNQSVVKVIASDYIEDIEDRLQSSTIETFNQNADFFAELRSIISSRTGMRL